MSRKLTKHRARTFRMYPTPEQQDRLAQWIGATRFVYNLALEQRRIFWRPGRRFDFVTQGREVTALRSQVIWINGWLSAGPKAFSLSAR